jgi:cytochrome c5
MKKMLIAATAGAVMMVSGQAVFAADKGEETFKTVCFACHATGAAGAPKVGDKAAWAPRIKQGMATLKKHAISGFSSKPGSMMPAKGGRPDLSDADVEAAIKYMVSKSK